jgi:hypothetical protein
MTRSIIPLGLAWILASSGLARADDPAGLELFEKEVRPILVKKCLSCHGPKKKSGGLRLDSREKALEGGDSGPAVVPGKPDKSVLIEAINYGEFVQMPPKSKLPASEIAALTKWVEMGAPWTSEAKVKEVTGSAGVSKTFNIKERARHWSFQPIRSVEPPHVQDIAWPITTADRFLLAALEAKGLHPAPDADKRTLIRRVTFDLTGLPPTAEEVEAFVNSSAADAYDKVVERLLASPQYGERWARHWLDLVRFAETAGHEFDYEIPGAWRYRDYLIRAFNTDLPYDQLVVEHLAGDLLTNPRRHPSDRTNESILATGFFALGEGTHSPVDVREEQVRRVDNQIDVFSKTFLGLTVACARCHDHKFDPISTKDYYALFGYLRSSRYQQAFIDPPDRIQEKVAELENLRSKIKTHCSTSGAGADFRIAEYLLSAERARRGPEKVESIASSTGLDPDRLARWIKAVSEADQIPGHPFRIGTPRPASSEAPRRPDSTEVFEDFRGPGYPSWFVTGDAFGSGPTRLGDAGVSIQGAKLAVSVPVAGVAHSGLVSKRLQGVLRSRSFTIESKFVHYLASGEQGRINLVVDGFEKIRDPIYGALTIEINHANGFKWYSQDVSMWIGHQAYIELADGAAADFSSAQTRISPGDGYLAVDEIRMSDRPALPHTAWESLDCDTTDANTLESRAKAVENAVLGFVESLRNGTLGNSAEDTARQTLLAELLDHDLVRFADLPPELAVRRAEIEATIPAPTLALAIVDGTGEDERVMVRGGYKTPGEVVPRRFLEVIAGETQTAPTNGSGRLELARRVIDPANPLPARVLVNRLWKHHFGDGLVRSVDDFGAMGERPSNPELLDWLARQFVEGGWSIKAMHREMVLSRAYRMASTLDSVSESADPNNRLLHRMNVRRLESEAIRDAMLAVSGRLDRTPFGRSVPPYLTPFMDGRGRPAATGPLDGAGRRTVYLNVRRNFLNPMLLAFDFPAPASTMGRRNVSNVPAQALTLLNDPFVLDQARLWADRLCSAPGGPRSAEARLADAYVSAFARPPTDSERSQALDFLSQENQALRGADDPRSWASLCHVLFNTKEFLFIP